MMQLSTTIDPANASDAELVARSEGGDLAAFALLVERHQSAVCAIAYSLLGDQARSEDVAQEVFVSLWSQLGTLRQPERLRGWLCGTTRNKSRMLRRRTRREVLDPTAGHDTPDAPPLEALVRLEEKALVWKALEEMPEQYREPLVLFYREDKSVRSVAEALGLSEAAVKKRLSRGRATLRNGLEEMIEKSLVETRPCKALAAGVVALLASRAGAAAAAEAAQGSELSGQTFGTAWLIAAAGLLALCLIGGYFLLTSGSSATRGRESAVASTPEAKSPPIAAPQRNWPTLDDTSEVFARVEVDDDALDPANPEVIVEIVDVLGGPIAGAAVFEDDRLVGTTDQRGQLRLSRTRAAATGRTRFRAQAHGYSANARSYAGYGRVTLELFPESIITGTVVEATTGAPLSGVEVLISDSREPVITDASGRFAFDSLSPGSYRISARSPSIYGAAPVVELGLYDAVTDVVIEAAPAYTVAGRVESERPGAQLPRHIVGIGNHGVPIAPDGSFRFDGVPPGKHMLGFSIGRDSPYAEAFQPTRVVLVEDSDVLDVLVPLPDTAAVEVSVVEEDGSPIVGVQVKALQREEGSERLASCRTKKNGRCTLYGLDADTAVEVAPQLAAVAPTKVAMPQGELMHFVAPAMGAIAGQAVIQGNRPLAYHVIAVRERRLGHRETTVTDADGRFLISGLPPGRYELRSLPLSSDAFDWSRSVEPLATTTVELEGRELVTDVFLVADIAMASIAGRVVDEHGAPAAHVIVSHRREVTGTYYTGAFSPGSAATVTHEDGSFALDVYGYEASYYLQARSHNGGHADQKGIPVGTKDLVIELERANAEEL